MLLRCRPASTKHNSNVLLDILLTYIEFTHFYPSHTQKRHSYECRFCIDRYTRIPARTILAATPAKVASNAPTKVYLVFVTFAARK